MNIKEQHFMASHMKIFFVLFLLGLVGCMKVSFKCGIDNIDNAVEECQDNSQVLIFKDF